MGLLCSEFAVFNLMKILLRRSREMIAGSFSNVWRRKPRNKQVILQQSVIEQIKDERKTRRFQILCGCGERLYKKASKVIPNSDVFYQTFEMTYQLKG